MPSMPLIASSSGVATVSAIPLGFAPGYCARTTIEGGTTSGYSAIGRKLIAIAPPRKIKSEITPAKIGRSMKNLEKFIPVRAGFRRRGPVLLELGAGYCAMTREVDCA